MGCSEKFEAKAKAKEEIAEYQLPVADFGLLTDLKSGSDRFYRIKS